MAQDFASTRKLRRAIIAELARQQKADAEAAVKMRNCILAKTQNLLRTLSALLEHYWQQGSVSQADRELFATVAPTMAVDDWLTLQAAHAVAEQNSEALRQQLSQAQKDYSDRAPMGGISRLFKNDEQKRVIDALRTNRNNLAMSLQVADTELQKLTTRVQEQARSFFREAMSTQSLESLQVTSSPISGDVRTILAQMTEEMQRLVRGHSLAQSESIANVQRNVAALGSAYEN